MVIKIMISELFVFYNCEHIVYLFPFLILLPPGWGWDLFDGMMMVGFVQHCDGVDGVETSGVTTQLSPLPPGHTFSIPPYLFIPNYIFIPNYFFLPPRPYPQHTTLPFHTRLYFFLPPGHTIAYPALSYSIIPDYIFPSLGPYLTLLVYIWKWLSRLCEPLHANFNNKIEQILMQ